MTKFEKVSKALEGKTYNTDNYITVTKNVDARGGKYGIVNVINNNLQKCGYTTLNQIIEEYQLKL